MRGEGARVRVGVAENKNSVGPGMICIDTKNGKPTNPVRTDSGHRAAHVFSNIPGPEGTNELVQWGRRLHLPPFFIQDEKTAREHFDVWGKKLPKAVRLADREVGMRGMVKIIQRKRESDAGYNNGGNGGT